MIEVLQPNEIFVFGSNEAGRHVGGAAKQAKEKFGAIDGVGEGMTGQCYAFPTVSRIFEKRTISALRESLVWLVLTAMNNPDKKFLMTKVGCGIAGYDEEEMRQLFSNSALPRNIILPTDWL